MQTTLWLHNWSVLVGLAFLFKFCCTCGSSSLVLLRCQTFHPRTCCYSTRTTSRPGTKSFAVVSHSLSLSCPTWCCLALRRSWAGRGDEKRADESGGRVGDEHAPPAGGGKSRRRWRARTMAASGSARPMGTMVDASPSLSQTRRCERSSPTLQLWWSSSCRWWLEKTR